MEILKEAHKQYFFKCFPKDVVDAYSFDEHFNYSIRSFVTLKVGKRFISGTQGIELNSRQKITSDLLKLDSGVVEDGHWLWCYEGSTGKFDLLNFKEEDTLNKLIAELKENLLVTAILSVKR